MDASTVDLSILEELKRIHLLKLVVTHGSFQKAAVHAKVTRSAVSQAIAHLEKFFSTVLLVRDKGGVQPTAQCLELLAKVEPVFDILSNVNPANVSKPPMTWLDLGSSERFAVTVLPTLVGRLRQAIPGIRVTVRSARSARLCTMVRKGELCMALVSETTNMNGLMVVPLAEDRLGFFVSAALKPKKNALDLIKDLGLATVTPEPDGRPVYYTKVMRAIKHSKEPTYASDSYEALLSAACFGTAVALLPLRVAMRRRADLVEITPPQLIEKKIGWHQVCLVSQKSCDPEEREFLASHIKAIFKAEGDLPT